MSSTVRAVCPCGGAMFTHAAGSDAASYVRCPLCDLRSPNPLPTAADLQSLYDGYGDFTRPGHFESERKRRKLQADRLLAKVNAALGPLERGARLLEVGCSNGAMLANVQESSQLECHGVEVDPKSAAIAAAHLPSGRVHPGTLHGASFPSGHFSVLYAEQVIEHVLDTQDFLRECFRVLAPGGIAFFATPNFEGISARLFSTRWKEFDPGEHVRLFTEASLRYHVEAAGFTDVKTRSVGLSFMVDPGRRDMLPFRRDALGTRVFARALGLIGLADCLQAEGRAPAHSKVG